MRFLSLLLFALVGVSEARAQSHAVYRYDIGVIDSSIKCELGKVARQLARRNIDPNRLKAQIVVAGEETISKKVTDQIMSSLGYTQAQIEGLKGRGVI